MFKRNQHTKHNCPPATYVNEEQLLAEEEAEFGLAEEEAGFGPTVLRFDTPEPNNYGRGVPVMSPDTVEERMAEGNAAFELAKFAEQLLSKLDTYDFFEGDLPGLECWPAVMPNTDYMRE